MNSNLFSNPNRSKVSVPVVSFLNRDLEKNPIEDIDNSANDNTLKYYDHDFVD